MTAKTCTESKHFGKINGDAGGAQFCGACGKQVAWPQVVLPVRPYRAACTCWGYPYSYGYCPVHGYSYPNDTRPYVYPVAPYYYPTITCSTGTNVSWTTS